MKILIPNATGPTNIGDRAILEGLLKVIEHSFDDFELVVHSSTPEKYKFIKYKVKPHLYYWAVFEDRNVFVRIIRMVQLMYHYISRRVGHSPKSASGKLNEVINDYKTADLIIFVGGGYLRTSKGITQSINLLMILFQFTFTKLFKGKKVLAPGSFGPFAESWQERITARVLKSFDVVTVREEISYNLLKRYSVNNLIVSADHALLLPNQSQHGVEKGEVLGITLRNWNGEEATNKNNQLVVDAVIKFSKGKNIVIQPIVQVRSVDFGDQDPIITEEIVKKLKSAGLKVKETVILRDLNEAMRVYGELDLLVGMRMHSNIIAATQLRPFVAIAYEHKTRGIARQLGLEKYCLDFGEYEEGELLNLLRDAYDNRIQISMSLKSTLANLHVHEFGKWKDLLSNSKLS